jgi:hypothetical protein
LSPHDIDSIKQFLQQHGLKDYTISNTKRKKKTINSNEHFFTTYKRYDNDNDNDNVPPLSPPGEDKQDTSNSGKFRSLQNILNKYNIKNASLRQLEEIVTKNKFNMPKKEMNVIIQYLQKSAQKDDNTSNPQPSPSQLGKNNTNHSQKSSLQETVSNFGLFGLMNGSKNTQNNLKNNQEERKTNDDDFYLYGGLKNSSSSCYIDSILVPIFMKPNAFNQKLKNYNFYKNVANNSSKYIINTLQKIYLSFNRENIIQNGWEVTAWDNGLQAKLKSYVPLGENKNSNRQNEWIKPQDTRDFVSKITDILRGTVYENLLIHHSFDTTEYIKLNIKNSQVSSIITTSVLMMNGEVPEKAIVILHINRCEMNGLNNTKVHIYNEVCEKPLQAIVVNEGSSCNQESTSGHYFAYLHKDTGDNQGWYLYDDIKPKMEQSLIFDKNNNENRLVFVGKSINEINDEVFTNSTDFIYYKTVEVKNT